MALLHTGRPFHPGDAEQKVYEPDGVRTVDDRIRENEEIRAALAAEPPMTPEEKLAANEAEIEREFERQRIEAEQRRIKLDAAREKVTAARSQIRQLIPLLRDALVAEQQGEAAARSLGEYLPREDVGDRDFALALGDVTRRLNMGGGYGFEAVESETVPDFLSEWEASLNAEKFREDE